MISNLINSGINSAVESIAPSFIVCVKTQILTCPGIYARDWNDVA